MTRNRVTRALTHLMHQPKLIKLVTAHIHINLEKLPSKPTSDLQQTSQMLRQSREAS